MNIQSIPRAVTAIALLILCGATHAQENAVRQQVIVFVDELSAIPGIDIDRAAAVAAIDAMTPEQLQRIQSAGSRLPNWQVLPGAVAAVDEARQKHEQEVAARFLAAGGAEGAALVGEAETLEYFRSDFLFLLDQLDRFSPMMRPDFATRVAAVREAIKALPPHALPALRKVYEERAADLIIGGSGGGDATTQLLTDAHRPTTNGCRSGCGDLDVACWISRANCLVDEVENLTEDLADLRKDIEDFFDSFFDDTAAAATQLAQLPSRIASYFDHVALQVEEFVRRQLIAVTSTLPTTVAGALAYVGVNWNNVNWSQIAGSVPTIAPPCPQQAVDIAAEACDRGADALTQLVYELAPDDGLSLGFKLGVALVNYPLAYLCQCKDIQDAIAFANEEEQHRERTGARLDLRLSTRATEASVNTLRTSVRALDSDVAKVEAKLDTIGATTGRIDANTARIESTVARIENNVDRTESTSNDTERKIDALIEGNTEQQQVVADFTTLMKRLSIEENLLHNRPDALSLFQLPHAFGGNLESVGLIVADTIRMHLAAAQNIFGAERELQRGDALRLAGDFVKAYEAYRSAYTEAIK